MKILHLTLKKKWFDMIASGEKNEEYRELKPYWIKRLQAHYIENEDGSTLFSTLYYDAVCFHWGYKKNHPTTLREFKGIHIGPAKPEWSDNWQGDVFVIKLGEIISNN